MKQSWCSIYAHCDNKLVAIERVVSDGITDAYICGLGVNSNFRSQGIGIEICRRLVEHCIDNNLHIQLFCCC
ncbi:hypothetical protein R9X47_28655 [Wukongibacter baidiensis]|uniref:GNAT family N-acetyltransferase n=1 Tax=Wukongibacter baidiensis TaxID=1723361 RepID=UPI003D7F408F